MTGAEAFHTSHAVTPAFFENSIVAAAFSTHKTRCHLQHPAWESVKGQEPPLLNRAREPPHPYKLHEAAPCRAVVFKTHTSRKRNLSGNIQELWNCGASDAFT